MRIVRTRSIPNVDDGRLLGDLARIHESIHTSAGLRSWDQPRRGAVDLGMKGKKISAELRRRGHPPTGCRFCD